MPGFVTHSECARPPDDTFAFIVDLTRWPSFRGFGPLPGIVKAELAEGASMRLGARVRVTNTDGSVHTEIVEAFEPGRHLKIRMELGPPASYVLAGIEETVDLEPSGAGTRVIRRFDVTARSAFTAPVAWLFGSVLLHRAVVAHNEAVAAALRG